MNCAIFYGDGSVWEGDALEAPAVDVGVIIYADGAKARTTGRAMIFGWDYFLLKDHGWIGVNGEVDLIDHLLHDYPPKVLKGRMYPTKVWEEILARANQYPGFPNRSAEYPPFENGMFVPNKTGQTV